VSLVRLIVKNLRSSAAAVLTPGHADFTVARVVRMVDGKIVTKPARVRATAL
jgi:hypothetical protein